ncbi:ArsJ-associated glyceraldehyde-3-phosphate dehydrogenase [Cereibacter sphaeroides]|uniref:ArsJ-associated glyceraldehyde-3-phosphate dehydrogenase n=1 Tax=Cereibacter sphaeroides TaxID=1063 RepID=UPI001F3FEDA9|nr:ArsJ-associated glyceraldehyde-3-phosphate dehydrogenase [Cereibacter sphaeroides]MCE6949543.1 ArsJ-associated glyceraldehyde-3-phosphate dehydrogenase [Cereibacter sphaeroides]
MARIAINGLGRMGKLLLRALIDRGAGGEIVLLNDAEGDAAQHALLMEFDSVHGRWATSVAHEAESLTLGGHRIPIGRARRIEDLPLRDLGVDLVVDCTGVFKTSAKIAPYFEAVRKVVVSAPVKDGGALNLVYGINHHLYDGSQRLVTAASCTTNCLAPVVKVIHEGIGIRHGSITTIHDVTNTQTIVDRPAKDMRRARSALMNLIPTTTGSASAIGLIYPELKGRLNGHAVRVPLLNASLTDCVFEVARPTTAEEVNALFAEAARGALAGILGLEERPLVSSDFLNDPRSAVVDAASTMVVGGTQVKVYAWYDNEWGYVCRLAAITRMVAESLA